MSQDPTLSNPDQSWWSTPNENWAEKSETIHANWQVDTTSKLDAATALSALAFGYGSRTQYGTERAWDDLETDLQSDWDQYDDVNQNTWDTVRDAVKYGWAAGETKPTIETNTMPNAEPELSENASSQPEVSEEAEVEPEVAEGVDESPEVDEASRPPEPTPTHAARVLTPPVHLVKGGRPDRRS